MDNLNIDALRQFFDEDDEDRELNPPGRLTVRLMTPEESESFKQQGPLTTFTYNPEGHCTRITEADGNVLDPDSPFVRLPSYMSSISHGRYGENWAPHLEFKLWDEMEQLDDPSSIVAAKTETPWAYRPIRLRKLYRLSTAAGGWFQHPEGASKPEFVPLDEWLQMYSAYEPSRLSPHTGTGDE